MAHYGGETKVLHSHMQDGMAAYGRQSKNYIHPQKKYINK